MDLHQSVLIKGADMCLRFIGFFFDSAVPQNGYGCSVWQNVFRSVFSGNKIGRKIGIFTDFYLQVESVSIIVKSGAVCIVGSEGNRLSLCLNREISGHFCSGFVIHGGTDQFQSLGQMVGEGIRFIVAGGFFIGNGMVDRVSIGFTEVGQSVFLAFFIQVSDFLHRRGGFAGSQRLSAVSEIVQGVAENRHGLRI